MRNVTRTAAVVLAALTLPLSGCGAIGLLHGMGEGGDTTPTFTVEGTDNGDIDTLAAQTVSDVYRLLEGKLPNDAALPNELRLVSYDSTNPKGQKWCDGALTDDRVNASYCRLDGERLVAWDRGVLLPNIRETGGDLGVALVIAHETGHAADHAQAPDAMVSTLVAEQRADCVAGSYTRAMREPSCVT